MLKARLGPPIENVVPFPKPFKKARPEPPPIDREAIRQKAINYFRPVRIGLGQSSTWYYAGEHDTNNSLHGPCYAKLVGYHHMYKFVDPVVLLVGYPVHKNRHDAAQMYFNWVFDDKVSPFRNILDCTEVKQHKNNHDEFICYELPVSFLKKFESKEYGPGVLMSLLSTTRSAYEFHANIDLWHHLVSNFGANPLDAFIAANWFSYNKGKISQRHLAGGGHFNWPATFPDYKKLVKGEFIPKVDQAYGLFHKGTITSAIFNGLRNKEVKTTFSSLVTYDAKEILGCIEKAKDA